MKKLLFLGFILACWGGCAPRPVDMNTITVWHWMTDRQKVLEELADQYEQQTGIKVQMELYAPSDAYSKRIIASAQARALPDIYGILDKKKIFASFIESDHVADLTEEFTKNNSAWEQALFPKALNVNRFEVGNVYGVKPGIYGVPLDVTNIQMLYNKKLLRKAGIEEPPTDFNSFLQDVADLNRIGVPGLVSGWGELWMVNTFATNYALNIMGEEKVWATYRGEVPYTDPDWIKVFDVFRQLRLADALMPGIVTKPNKFAEQDFALERAAFAFNGSWCVNVYHDMNPDLEYGVMLPPSFNHEQPMRIWGGAGSSLVVNALSPRQEQAIAFLQWLTAKEQQTVLAKKTKNLPANRAALTSIPPILAEFAESMDNTTHPTLWKYNETPTVSERFDRGLQSIIIGEKTPEQVAEEVHLFKQQELRKMNR